ncbi:uncharacterized protein BP01DRAFT_353035 [Aspergillus saccharolyticus JOP 1030-1]|uniref:Uncharacterized protein n=1 Tax=Aspergillus saccharolyticus JOP 1030-1 TaxID=1450539 RepID=A0A318ZXB5_9EURO|nr:hypothetical protein BP01DRAFT_353035 [Aspergillus saccharolyticus JOP 1030-1]PYH48730.1 hypothetical protein BP01DRAFT_353035 [Aspergillus saccharolyticus JOP 1030-1]
MSDDEDYYDEYDEDIFWVEEPDPTIADDLAATSTTEAIFYDNPALEVEDYFSDWDDLSDDYYDDDPTAVRRARALGLLPLPTAQNQKQIQKQHQGGRAGVAATATGKHTAKTTLFFDLGAFQSVVWKSSSQEKEEHQHHSNGGKVHEPGEGEKVALLKNWREVFRSVNPGITAASSAGGAGRKGVQQQQQQQQQQGGLCLRGSSAGAVERNGETGREVDGVDGAAAIEKEPIEDATVKSLGKGEDGFVAAELVIDGGGGSEVGDEVFKGAPVGGEGNIKNATNGKVNGKTREAASELPPPTVPKTRKRKADEDTLDTAPQTRAKRVASTKVSPPDAPAPVRRSARNK